MGGFQSLEKNRCKISLPLEVGRKSEAQQRQANKNLFLAWFHVVKYACLHFSELKLTKESAASEGGDCQCETFIYKLRWLDLPCGQDSC